MKSGIVWLALLSAVLPWDGISPLAAQEIEVERDIVYSQPQGEALKLDLYRPKQIEGTIPGIICVHGGGWTEGTRTRWGYMCEQLAQRGYVAAGVQYRFTPKWPFPASVNDVKAAVRWLRANASRLHVDPQRIGALGDSAGGHLVLMLGTTGDVKKFDADGDNLDQSSRVQCVVDVHGPAEMVKLYGPNKNLDPLLDRLLGGPPASNMQRYRQASPICWATPDAPPTLLIHGTKDDVVLPEQSQWMYDRLQACGVQSELLWMEGAEHRADQRGSAKDERRDQDVL